MALVQAFNFKLVLSDGQEFLFKRISGLQSTVSNIELREPTSYHINVKVPKEVKFGDIKLERGLADNRAFDNLYQWYLSVVQLNEGMRVISDFKLQNIYKDVIIQVLNRNQVNVYGFNIHVLGAYPSQLSISDFDAQSSEVIIESITLSCKSWYFDKQN